MTTQTKGKFSSKHFFQLVFYKLFYYNAFVTEQSRLKFLMLLTVLWHVRKLSFNLGE